MKKLATNYKNTNLDKQSLMNMPQDYVLSRTLAKSLFCGVAAMAFVTIFAETAFADFDLTGGIKETTKPIEGAIKDHWGKAVGIASIIGMATSQGDGWQRSVGGLKFAAFAGGAILGILKMFGG